MDQGSIYRSLNFVFHFFTVTHRSKLQFEVKRMKDVGFSYVYLHFFLPYLVKLRTRVEFQEDFATSFDRQNLTSFNRQNSPYVFRLSWVNLYHDIFLVNCNCVIINYVWAILMPIFVVVVVSTSVHCRARRTRSAVRVAPLRILVATTATIYFGIPT